MWATRSANASFIYLRTMHKVFPEYRMTLQHCTVALDFKYLVANLRKVKKPNKCEEDLIRRECSQCENSRAESASPAYPETGSTAVGLRTVLKTLIGCNTAQTGQRRLCWTCSGRCRSYLRAQDQLDYGWSRCAEKVCGVR